MIQHRLPSLEAIAYPKEHTFAALQRIQVNTTSCFAEFYRTIHSRPDFTNFAQYLPIPTIHETDDIFSQPLAQSDPDIVLSIVITTRNDTHVERMEERTQAFLDGIYYLAGALKRKVELIIVEWNPPSGRPSMAQQYRYPGQHKYVSTVIVTVPNSIHSQYRYAKDLPLYQMIAKNIGIRRARGRYVLVTNVDILFSTAMFGFMTSPDQLKKNTLYRANRWDVDRDILDENSVEEMIEKADGKCIRKNTRQGAAQSSWIRGEWDQDYKEIEISFYAWFPDLHTEGCGDFQLMDRNSWLTVGGYSEVDAFSMHIDSLFALTCHHAGIKEHDLKDELLHFHIDHSLGNEIKPSVYLTRSKTELKHPSMMTLFNLHACMTSLKSAYAFNENGWGMAETQLSYERVSTADWDKEPIEYRVLSEKGGSRIVMEDMAWDDHLLLCLSDWSDDGWDQTVEYLIGIKGTRSTALWGMGGRARNALFQFEKRDYAIDLLIDDKLTPISDDVLGYETLKESLLSADFFQTHIVVIASIFAEQMRPKLESLGAVAGKDYIVTI